MTLFESLPINWHYPLHFPAEAVYGRTRVLFLEMHFGDHLEDVPEHAHVHFESIYFIAGTGRYTFIPSNAPKAVEFNYRPGTLLTAAPGCLHFFTVGSRTRLAFWNWRIKKPEVPVKIPAFEFAPDGAARIAPVLHLIGQEGYSSDQASPGEIKRLIRSLFLNMERILRPGSMESHESLIKRVPKNTLVKDVLLYLERFYHQPLRLNEIASRFKVSGRHLIRILKQQEPPVRFSDALNRIRIEAACECIRRDPGAVFARIAEQCGFQDEFYFSKVFKKLKNLSPGAYRAKTAFRTARRSPASSLKL